MKVRIQGKIYTAAEASIRSNTRTEHNSFGGTYNHATLTVIFKAKDTEVCVGLNFQRHLDLRTSHREEKSLDGVSRLSNFSGFYGASTESYVKFAAHSIRDAGIRLKLLSALLDLPSDSEIYQYDELSRLAIRLMKAGVIVTNGNDVAIALPEEFK